MNEIHDIVVSIVKGCARGGIDVSEILAAFTAQTIIESDEKNFILDRNVTVEGTESVVIASIQKLLEKDNPALETMKMQVDYDSFSQVHDVEAQKLLQQRNKLVTNHRQAIMDTNNISANDFAALTTLYRKIFRYLIEFSPNIKVTQDKNMDREVAAALESVFPRVGLKAFVELPSEEKSWQLQELGRIILGIRLYNREHNRGGVGLEPMDRDSIQLVSTMHEDITSEMNFFTDACQKYQYAIVKATYHQRRYEKEKKILSDLHQVPDFDDHQHHSKAMDSLTPQQRQVAVKQQEKKLDKLPVPLPQQVIDRWVQELTNRRQYLSYLKIFHDEVTSLRDRIYSINESLQLELRNLSALINNRTSVPKEVVYPRFDAVGGLWVKLYDDVTMLIAWSKTYKILCKYRLSFHPTLSEKYCMIEDLYNEDIDVGEVSVSEMMNDMRSSILTDTSILSYSNDAVGVETSVASNMVDQLSIHAVDIKTSVAEISSSSAIDGEAIIDPATIVSNDAGTMILNELHGNIQDEQPPVVISAVKAQLHPDNQPSKIDLATIDPGSDDDMTDTYSNTINNTRPSTIATSRLDAAASHFNRDIEANVVNASGATLLSIENTPDFLLLPLELQGYCPWTIVHARGLLIPGQPKLGVVRYHNQYFVFDHEIGIKAFVNDPEFYLQKIKDRTLKSPEFIHLLRLQKWFPKASIARLLENPDADAFLSQSRPNMKDVGTSTPTHFIESYIDLNYYWNEWEMRKNALKIINLKHCITNSSQTDASHFRRDNDTQVYLPKDNDTQTRRDKGINPPKVTSYVAGLRGKVKEGQSVSKYMKVLPVEKGSEPGTKKDRTSHIESRPHVVMFTTDF